VTKLPVRVRLTAWYAALLAVIIAALGAFVVLQLRDDLHDTIDREVRSGASHISRDYSDEGVEDLRDAREDFRDVAGTVLPRAGAAAQVVDPDGDVVLAHGDVATSAPLVPPEVRERALAGEALLLTVSLEPSDQHFRAMVAPVSGGVLIVAESLQSAEESVRRLLVLLLLAGPAALAFTTIVGWWMAGKALRPVERMAAQAEEIGIDRLDERIPVPPADDELRRLAVTLNAMLGRLERGVEEKHRLIADASHELRTPLTVMRTELDVALRDDALPAGDREILESLREEVDRLSRTADNLLTLAQVDEGRLELLTRPVRLDDAIDAATRPLRPLADAKRLRLEVDADGQEARADPQRLHQVLTNFIDNAIKHAPPGSEVRVTAWSGGDEVGFTVADEGPGIPEDARQHVFDRFFRVDRARGRESGGGGLGLAICREVARAHGGRVWVDSVEGRGSAFSMALPRAEER
jgi:heavy metal sensor kinase